MTAATLPAAAVPAAASNGRTLLTVAAFLMTYMQSVNISIPNAALLHLQGTLSMADDEVGWVFTSYIAASVIVIPLSGWLAARFDRRTVLQFALTLFAFGLMFDTLADAPMQFVFARIFQGLASGPLGPLSLAILLDIHPPARHTRIIATWTIMIIVGISTGPSIGGWLSEYRGWQWIFYLSLPAAGFIFLVVTLWLPEKKAEKNPPFDFVGWAALAMSLMGLQALLDRGERVEWFRSTESWVEAIVALLGACLYFEHVISRKTHFLDKALFRDRNFVLSVVMHFAFGFVLLPTLALTSPMLDELLNYPADTTGFMTIPRGGGLVGMLILMSWVPARIDHRLLAAGGMAFVIYANALMLGYSPEMDWRLVATAGGLQGIGLGILMPALTKMAFTTLPQPLHQEGHMVFNLSRLYGATIGVAVVQIFVFGNTQAMHLALGNDLTPFRAAAHATATSSSLRDLAMLNETITGQAALVSVIDEFKVLMLAMVAVSPLVLFLRNSRSAPTQR